MTEWTDFNITDIVKHGCTLLGNKADRQNTVEYILSRWDTDGDGTLIVLDPDGTFYEKYGGNAMLVDLESANSVLPDVYCPILSHKKYGRSPKTSAKLIGDIVIHEKQDKTSNDMFWSQNGKQTLLEYLEYSLLFASINRRKGKDTGNIFLDAAAEHDYLQHLMNELVTRAVSAAERWDTEENSAWKSNRKLLPVLTEREWEFKEKLAMYYGEGTIPFSDTLVSYGKPGQSNTPICTMRTAQSMGKAIFELNQKIKDDFEFYTKLPFINLHDLITTKSETNKIMFLVGCTDKDIASLYALLMLLGCAVAADNDKSHITCFIPDISVWNIFDGLCKLKNMFYSTLQLVVGCSDFPKAARYTELSTVTYLDKLCDLTEQNIIWHKSNDDLLIRTFKDRTNGLNLMYSLTDLGTNRMAAIEQKNEIRYVYIPEADCIGYPAVREEIYEVADNHDLWFFAQKTIKQELEELDKKHKDIDAISEILLGDNDDDF